MKPYHFKTLRSRLTAFLISPVVIILLAAGISGFIYAREVMLGQWNERVILELSQAAHEIQMRLARPVELMEMFSELGTDRPDASLLEVIVTELEDLPGVVRSTLNWHPSANNSGSHGDKQAVKDQGRFMRFKRGGFTKITPPKVDDGIGEPTVSITMVLMDAYDTPVGNLEIVIKFNFLVAERHGLHR